MIQLYQTFFFLSYFILSNHSITVQDDYEALVAAERGFALQAENEGIRRAFLSNLDRHSVVFVNNTFVSGTQVYAQQPDGPGYLSWRPAYAEISASGEFGYTTGPFEFRRSKKDGVPISCGQYTSVWHKTDLGQWKVLIDFGCEHDQPGTPAPTMINPEWFGLKDTVAVDTAQASQELLLTEGTFSRLVRQSGLSHAYRDLLPTSDSVRILRNGSLPLMGKGVNGILESETQTVTYQPIRAVTSRAGDLGYTYGFAVVGEKRMGYLRIWRKRGGAWQLAQEVR
ncbi:hypothetical protein [Salmonirosea aquatica]|uniref:DUF4440 domain-containing protein n=1 Tax=Salmonirosea aquatica TaxID=2654236 RepID=A0A7C9BLF4_9BACT|nr:hypothetical protein [Cytophagaceae bacterium SJW1-29]